MQRLLAVLLVLIGLTGLVLGRLGETTWAPETETTATVDLSDAGPAVVIDPGVLYVGGEEGELVIEGASDVSVITAGNGDIAAYLEDVHYTRITGASDWTTLSTQDVNPDGAEELTDPTSSDLWRTVDTAPSPYTLDIAEFWAAENGENEKPYRALLIVTDGTQPGAETVSITWPVDAENEWVPFAYAGGAAIAVVGLVLLVVSLGGRRRDEDQVEEVADAPRPPADTSVVPVAAGAAGSDVDADTDADADPSADADADPASAGAADSTSADDSATSDDGDRTDDSGADFLFGTPGQGPREENVWSLGTSSTEGSAAAEDDGPAADAPATDAPADDVTPAADDRTEQIDAVDDEEGRR